MNNTEVVSVVTLNLSYQISVVAPFSDCKWMTSVLSSEFVVEEMIHCMLYASSLFMVILYKGTLHFTLSLLEVTIFRHLQLSLSICCTFTIPQCCE